MAGPVLASDDAVASLPSSHRGPRGRIVLHLKESGRATAKELAQRLRLSLNAVRHHLRELDAEGVIAYDRTPNGVGAPAHAYRLTGAGHALFPDRYERTLADLLDHVVRSEGRPAAVALLESQYRALAERLATETASMDAESRARHIAAVLRDEGYMASWVAAGDGGLLTESNCPHRIIAERFPELCAAEEAFLAQVFGGTVARQSRIAGGCGTCSYQVAFAATEGAMTR